MLNASHDNVISERRKNKYGWIPNNSCPEQHLQTVII